MSCASEYYVIKWKVLNLDLTYLDTYQFQTFSGNFALNFGGDEEEWTIVLKDGIKNVDDYQEPINIRNFELKLMLVYRTMWPYPRSAYQSGNFSIMFKCFIIDRDGNEKLQFEGRAYEDNALDLVKLYDAANGLMSDDFALDFKFLIEIHGRAQNEASSSLQKYCIDVVNLHLNEENVFNIMTVAFCCYEEILFVNCIRFLKLIKKIAGRNITFPKGFKFSPQLIEKMINNLAIYEVTSITLNNTDMNELN